LPFAKLFCKPVACTQPSLEHEPGQATSLGDFQGFSYPGMVLTAGTEVYSNSYQKTTLMFALVDLLFTYNRFSLK